MTAPGNLYLIPNFLGNPNEIIHAQLPAHHIELVRTLDEFVVENGKNARAFFKKIGLHTPQDQLKLHELNAHTTPAEWQSYLDSCKKGKNMVLLSDAGLPCVADPGAVIVKQAHKLGIKVIPLIGPSSILLALMASGFNGQQFAFHGYLPVDQQERGARIRQLEKESAKENRTQIFIETPYRNNAMLADLLRHCRPETSLCIACDLTLPGETIISRPVKEWKKGHFDFHKRPAVFLLLA